MLSSRGFANFTVCIALHTRPGGAQFGAQYTRSVVNPGALGLYWLGADHGGCSSDRRSTGSGAP